MDTAIDIGNLKLYPGQFLEFSVLKLGNETAVSEAVHAIKGALANDDRWNYQGSAESQHDGRSFVTITVQVRKSYQPTNTGGASLAMGIAPIVYVGVVAAVAIVGLIRSIVVARANAVKEWSITVRESNMQVVAIYQNENLTESEKATAAAAITGNVAKAASVVQSQPLVSTGGGLSLGLILVGGGLLFAFFSGKLSR